MAKYLKVICKAAYDNLSVFAEFGGSGDYTDLVFAADGEVVELVNKYYLSKNLAFTFNMTHAF